MEPRLRHGATNASWSTPSHDGSARPGTNRRLPVDWEPMERTQQFTAILSKEEDQYVALCPELDIASQGATVEEACANLVEALELFLETASPQEISGRLHKDVFVTRVEVKVA